MSLAKVFVSVNFVVEFVNAEGAVALGICNDNYVVGDGHAKRAGSDCT